ncbi:uncharacterized protein A1O9_00004 [Exophiala aquamarina CBS 119918]|uniref:Choline transport protein n=1 Tax=Exophiala aquamarina CBS 119918 TaxID=1182545 RepID=A0A072PQK0_9EURO|nr:uncharacterized protein A1O9_00004 [Exophiala aquamarina CBS 119918]KEF62032.1 hypothetical protein A1O9_00004 [Exophiala aquamarina CBS 119918]
MSEEEKQKADGMSRQQQVDKEFGLGDLLTTPTQSRHVTPKKPFTLWSALSLGFNITNTGISIILVVGNTAFGAGPLFFYSTLLMAAVTFCVAITLGELTSAYPHAGGQYFWAAQLSPAKHRRFFSYMTAILSWAAVICICASSAQASANIVFQMVTLSRPDFAYQRWMGFLAMETFNILAASLTIYEFVLPQLAKGFLIYVIVVTMAIFICLLAPSSPKQSAAEVFGAGKYFNLSGWPNGMAFLIGMNGVNWSFSCLDAATHLSEEIQQPRKNIPKALMCITGMGCLVGVMISLGIYFAAFDLDKTTDIIALLNMVYRGNPTCAYVFGVALLGCLINALSSAHAWQARITWSLSRDKGTPFHSFMSRLAPAPYYTPLWATLWGVCWVALCGLLYLASLTAFNAFISGGVLLQYITYATPAALLLARGRKSFHDRGPFFWPRFGLVANVIVILWTVLTLVVYSFPYFLPVAADSMNYVSVVMVFALVYATAFWIVYGRKHYELADIHLALD